tara:strand:- start:231 stop:794 length:564 start_codon:yes stop_codon:yes gene_type:complete
MARDSVRPELSSSRLFTQGSKDLNSGVVDATHYNFMSSSFKTNEYLSDSGIFGIVAPLVYQMDLIKDDIDNIHSEVSASAYTETINSGSFISEIKTFTARDTTPSVKNGHLFKTANDRGISITEFDDGAAGQQITIIIKDGNTGFTHDRSKLFLNGGNNVLRFVSGDTISFVYDGTTWYETHRSDNT